MKNNTNENTIVRVYARKCQIVDISKDAKLVKSFLNENHQQKWCRGNKVAFGLFFNGEMVQLMTFGKPRFNKNYQWEIIRECSKKNTVILGGSSKLFKAFMDAYSPENVIVYTDTASHHLMQNNDHYVKHLGFNRLKNPRNAKIERWVSKTFPREDGYGQDYSATSIRHYGPDRMLGTKLGFSNGSNDEIMQRLGYEKTFVTGKTPRVDVWHRPRFGYCYRVDCSCGLFYVGMSTKTDLKNIRNYKGSGKRWLAHLNGHVGDSGHRQKKTIISYHDDFDSLVKAEINLIQQYIEDKNCCNLKTEAQNSKPSSLKNCSDCGSSGAHRKTCSKFIATVCEECSGRSKRHKKHCSKFQSVLPCEECEGRSHQHKKHCSKFIARLGINCPECQSSSSVHKKTCSLRVAPKGCSECGSSAAHKMFCSKYSSKILCDECNTRSNHKKDCSQWVQLPGCPSCGSRSTHKKFCEKFKNRI